MKKLTPVSIGLIIRNLGPEGLDLWCQKRKEQGPLNELWEFPGGKWEPGESPGEACQRELKEETGVLINNLESFKTYAYEYPDRSVVLNSFLGSSKDMPESENQKWFRISFKKLPSDLLSETLSANKEIIHDLICYFKNEDHQKNWELLWE